MTAEDLRVGVDLGGTKTAAGLVAPDGTLSARAEAPTPARSGPDAVLRTVAALVAEVDPQRRAGTVGVGAAGVVDSRTGRVVASTDAIAGWAGTDVAGGLRALTGRPVAVTGDVHAFLLGELAHGAARGRRDVVAVTVGTGVGGALVLGGRLHGGHRHVAGHLGHVPSAAATDRPCGCGRRGHVEGVASGPAMSAAYAVETGEAVSGLADVAERAAAGDRVAGRVLHDGGHALGVALAGVVNTVAPELVVVGGGVAGGVPTFVDSLRSGLASSVLPALADVPVVGSRLGASAAIVGAARTAVPEVVEAVRG